MAGDLGGYCYQRDIRKPKVAKIYVSRPNPSGQMSCEQITLS